MRAGRHGRQARGPGFRSGRVSLPGMSRVSLPARVRPPEERALRIRRRMLQTPVVRFEHPKTGRTVTVTGVVHIARTGYYRQLGIMLTKLEAAGALVFYEGIGHAAETEWSAAGRAERDTWNTARTGSRELTQAACRGNSAAGG
jgi:hypothetical protein